MRRALLSAGLLVLLAVGFSLPFWGVHPSSERSHDRGTNGLWIGHRWYSGRDVRTNAPVTDAEIATLAQTLSARRIRYAFAHAGPIRADGSIEDPPSPAFARLRAAAPATVFLAWLGARVEKVDLESARWREGVLATIAGLADAGFAGVHFDLEPLGDGEPGYVELLAAVHKEFGAALLVSQATPRAGLFGIAVGPLRQSTWSGDFYRRTMQLTDQTVVMAYDTKLGWTRAYQAFVRHQTALLSDWACAEPGHQLLVGIPSYEDVPSYSDPEVENIRSGALGVRAALDRMPEAPCFSGVSIYANWVTEPAEWEQYRRFWTLDESD